MEIQINEVQTGKDHLKAVNYEVTLEGEKKAAGQIQFERLMDPEHPEMKFTSIRMSIAFKPGDKESIPDIFKYMGDQVQQIEAGQTWPDRPF